MKSFSKSTLFGLTFGVLLAGYAVFAFTSPSSAPPAGNVPAPLNTGPGNQTKTGGVLQVFGLWVEQSLGVTGGGSFGGILDLGGNRITNVGSPSAAGDVATKGYADSQVGKFSWDANCVMVENANRRGNACNSEARCPAGYKVTGGGCSLWSVDEGVSSYPASDGMSWVCSSGSGACTARAICCKQ